MAWRFRPRLVPTLFVVLGAGFLASLGNWQMRRLREAEGLRASYVARLAAPAFDAGGAVPPDPDRVRVRLTGTPDWERRMILPNRYMWSYPGMNWVVPVQIEGSERVVLVDVGWVPNDEADAVLARERGRPGPRVVEGLARVVAAPDDAAGARIAVEGTGVPSAGTAPTRWARVAPATMAASIGVAPQGFYVVEGEGLAEDAGIADRDPPIGGWRTTPPERPHGQYAFTWYALGVTLVAVWLSASFRREESVVAPT